MEKEFELSLDDFLKLVEKGQDRNWEEEKVFESENPEEDI